MKAVVLALLVAAVGCASGRESPADGPAGADLDFQPPVESADQIEGGAGDGPGSDSAPAADGAAEMDGKPEAEMDAKPKAEMDAGPAEPTDGAADPAPDVAVDPPGDACKPSDGKPPWAWEGDTTAGWSISNIPPSGTSSCSSNSTWDCCGCACTTACANDTASSTDGAVATFGSGPPMDRRQGFTATYSGIPVVGGLSHTLVMDIADLVASHTGASGSETAACYLPTWTLEVREAGVVKGSLSGSWGSAQCATCTVVPANLGLKSLSFTPSGTAVDLLLYARYGTSQCSGALQIAVKLNYIRISGC